MLTPRAAKARVADELKRCGLPAFRLTARTVSFTDLARESCVFVKIHDWETHPAWLVLDRAARASGFRIEAG